MSVLTAPPPPAVNPVIKAIHPSPDDNKLQTAPPPSPDVNTVLKAPPPPDFNPAMTAPSSPAVVRL